MEFERKNILLKVNNTLVPIETDKNKYEIRISSRKSFKKSKNNEVNSKEKAALQKFIYDSQIKINTKLSKNLERYKEKTAQISDQLNAVFSPE